MTIFGKLRLMLIKLLANFLPENILSKLKTEGFRRYFKNTSWMFFGRVFTLIFSFFIGVYVARYLEPANYGILNYVMSFVLIFSFIPSFGIDAILGKELVKHPEKKDQYLGTGFIIKIVSGIFSIIVISVVSLIVNKDVNLNLLVFVFSLTYVFQAFNVIETWFSSQVRSKNGVLAQMFATICCSVLKLVFVILHFNIYWILTAFMLESFFLAIGLAYAFKKNKHAFSGWKFDKSFFVYLLKVSWPLMLSALSGVIFLRIDQVMLKFYLGAESVGLYSAAAKLSEVMYFVPGLLVASLFPAIVNAKTVSNSLFENRLKKLYLMMFAISFLISVVIYLVSDYLILALFGQAYVQSSAVLKIYIWSLIPIFLGNVVNYYLIVENYTKIALFISAGSAIINVLLNLFLIPHYGMIGAAWATFYAALSMVIFPVFFKKTRKQLYLMATSFVLK